MKKIWFSLALVFFSVHLSHAQEDGAELVKRAGQALNAYNMDPVNNSAKLAEGMYLIEKSMEIPEVRTMVTAWFTKGDIYFARLESDLRKMQLDPNAPLAGDNDALVAFEAYKIIYNASQKPNEKSLALRGIGEVQGTLVQIGRSKFEKKEYEKSFLSLQASLESHHILKENGLPSVLDGPQQLEDQIYITGLSAILSSRCPDAMVLFDQLYNVGTDRPEVYEGLFNCKLQLGDEAGAERILSEGREKFPKDPGLLFAEINQYLKAGKLHELTTRLEQAIELEPNNISLYVTLGNVYDNLYQSASQNNDAPNENAYFEKAKEYYSRALLRDPKNLDANYALGSLYYNKAALRTQQMNSLPEDFSSKGLEKLNEIRNEVLGLFDQSLPYFKKAENIDPNDINTLIALTEIYSRKDDLVISAEMRNRLEVVKGGGKNISSYFHVP